MSVSGGDPNYLYPSNIDITHSDIQPPYDISELDLSDGFGGFKGAGRLIVTPTNKADTLVNAILGKGITASNIVYTGSETSSGTFIGGIAGGLGIESGVILTCGDSKLAEGNDPGMPGVNTSDNASESIGIAGDADLSQQIGGGITNDASVLEFDFVSDGGDLYVSFVFASEEYNEYVYSFNDVFAFFLDGENIALVPNTNVPVSVDNINGGNPFGTNPSYPGLYNNNDISDGGPFFANEYDGFTTVLVASSLNSLIFLPLSQFEVTILLRLFLTKNGHYWFDDHRLHKGKGLKYWQPLLALIHLLSVPQHDKSPHLPTHMRRPYPCWIY